MDLRTRPMWSVRAMRRLMTRPATRACVEAPLPSHPAPVAVARARASTAEEARVAAPPNSSRVAAQAKTPSAPVRVVATAPATTTALVSPPLGATPAVAAATATAAPAAADAPASGPPRVPTAPVKHGRAYDWTGLP